MFVNIVGKFHVTAMVGQTHVGVPGKPLLAKLKSWHFGAPFDIFLKLFRSRTGLAYICERACRNLWERASKFV